MTDASEDYATLKAMRGSLRELPGWSIRAELFALDRSLRLFVGNARDLSQFLAAAQRAENLPRLWSVDNRDGFDRFLEEVDRLLHNFLVASASLRDHQRSVKTKLLPDEPSDMLAAEYDAQSATDFGQSPLAQFVKGLRNFTTHRRLPVTTGRLTWTPDEGERSRVILHPSELLEWPKWNAHARQFIADAGDEISIEGVVAEYTRAAIVFQASFQDLLVRRHRTDLDALAAAVAEFREWREQAAGSPRCRPPQATLGAVIAGLDHVQVAAPPGCEDEAHRFYGGLLGLPELEKPEPLCSRGGVWFACGEQQLHVGVDPEYRPARKAHPAFAVEEYDELQRRLRNAGVGIEDDTLPGVRRCYVHDPWGNRLELVEAASSTA